MFPTMHLTNGFLHFPPTNTSNRLLSGQGKAGVWIEDAFLPGSLVQFGRVI